MTQEQIQNQPHVKKAYMQMREESAIRKQSPFCFEDWLKSHPVKTQKTSREREIETKIDRLVEERNRLVARIKEIDAQLFGMK